MAQENVSETSISEKSERLVQWFFAAVGLIYGCGFLIVFTFFKGFGVDSADFVEAKYIHVGFLFFMACLVIAVPLWWLLWPLRSKAPVGFSIMIRKGLLKKNTNGRIKYFFGDPLKSFFSPKWSIDATHGINAGASVRISMILILWSFVTIVMFAPPEFGKIHAELLIFNFLTPMVVLILGFLGDFFKAGEFSKSQYDFLIKTRLFLRVWWLAAGVTYLICFLIIDSFRQDLWPLAAYFLPPIAAIIRAFCILFASDCGRRFDNLRTKIGVCQWSLYTLQWAAVVMQIWVFIWTIKHETLEVSLLEVLFGKNYISDFWTHISNGDFPHGGIYFVFFIILISFFVIRNIYRLKQIEKSKDKSYKLVATISVATIVSPLAYISILSFAHNIYSYVPYEKGGGDYSRCHPVQITFNTNAVTQSGLPIVIPPELISLNGSNCLIRLDENSSFVFLAATNDVAGSPEHWRYEVDKPKVYEVRREAITCIAEWR